MATPSLQSLERGLAILESLCRNPGSGIDALANELKLSRGTVYRLLETLRREGYVERVHRGMYLIAGQAQALSDGCEAQSWVTDKAQAAVTELAQMIGFSTVIACPDEAEMIVRYAAASGAVELVEPALAGSARPMLRSAAGRAYLAHCDGRLRRRLLRMIVRDLHATAEARAADVQRQELSLEKIRADGFAICNVGHSEAQLAVPIFDRAGVVGALSISYYRGLMPARAACARFLGALRRTARIIEQGPQPLKESA